MDNENNSRGNLEKHGDMEGVVLKAAEVSPLKTSDDEMVAINKLTLEPLESEDVFTFKVAMCDNEIDRTFEVFPSSSLNKMQSLFIGKTVIKDHQRSSDNQVARVYETELVASDTEVSKTGEPYTQLVAHCYMLNTESNKDLIAQVKGGIKKEVSVGLSIGKAVCSICEKDNTKEYCRHYWGKEYDGETCYFKLEDPTDAYELSFVAVPAQPKAGTVKSYGATFKEFDEKVEKKAVDNAVALRLKNINNFMNIQNNLYGEEIK